LNFKEKENQESIKNIHFELVLTRIIVLSKYTERNISGFLLKKFLQEILKNYIKSSTVEKAARKKTLAI
jgi:hypothetical protein